MVLELRPYQLKGAGFLARHRRAILADAMGLGKTAQTITALKATKPRSVLIISSDPGTLVWREELHKWGFYDKWKGPEAEVISGFSGDRYKQWQKLAKSPDRIAICNWTIAQRDGVLNTVPTGWHAVIADEAHRAKNRKTNNYKALKMFSRNSDSCMLVTGSPSSKGPQDLWAYLNVINENTFRSYWRFVNAFCEIDDSYGQKIIGSKNVDSLNKLLANYMIRRTKEDVGIELPPKLRYTIPVAMDRVQLKMYEAIISNLIYEISPGHYLLTPNDLAKIMRLRQMLCTPRLIDPNCGSDGASINFIIEQQKDNNEPHFVVFTPFVESMPYYSEALRRAGFGNIIELKGGISLMQLEERLKRFRNERATGVVSIQYAQSFDMSSCSYGYFCGHDWDPEYNRQAEDRLHRFDSRYPVNIGYMRHVGSVEDDFLNILVDKDENVSQYCSTADDFRQILERSIETLGLSRSML